MRKLLHLVLAIWKTGRPFNPEHYPWPAPAHAEAPDQGRSAADQAAGHTPDTKPAKPVVTAACVDSIVETAPAGDGPYIDFDHLKDQLSLARVLAQLGLTARLRGSGPQRSCAGPPHRGHARGRAVRVNLRD